MPKAKKIGRPKLPKGHAKGQIRPVRFSDADLKLFNRTADKSEHKTLSSWIRHTLKEATMSAEERIVLAAREEAHRRGTENAIIEVTPNSNISLPTYTPMQWGVEINGRAIVIDLAKVVSHYGSTDIESIQKEIKALLDK